VSQFVLARCSVVVEGLDVNCLILVSLVICLLNYFTLLYLHTKTCRFCGDLPGRFVAEEFFDVMCARVGLSWLLMELLPSLGIVLN